MRLLCLDPGGTTGWCLVDVTDVFRHRTGNISSNSQDLERKLNALAKWKPDVVVCERLPETRNAQLRKVMEEITRLWPTITYYGPGEWKPVTGKVPIPPMNRPPYHYTPHERDAYRMAIYHLRKIGSRSTPWPD